ncbi:hypothetical protein [Pinibacter soli]|uniref:Uncharacterized protein n=1 Tax=Pinibacter soli TaxID=3044211 RepID=A0ABT6R9B3_9BACT|nr:hypothetical protein [Pinibacter soli]MDI3319148.1 hypothetical protein [Pinibacter soli]
MTVKELKQKLHQLPDHMDVFIKQVNDEYPVSLVAVAEKININFSDGHYSAKDECLVLSDECLFEI